MLVGADLFGHPMTAREQEQAYEESVRWYAMYGLSMRPVPPDLASFRDYWNTMLNDVLEPTAINVLPSGTFLYVAAYDTTASANYIFGFAVGSGGALTPVNSGNPLGGGAFATGVCPSAYLNAPYVVGTCPSAIGSDSTSAYVYVGDSKNGDVHGYSVASDGTLAELSGSPFPAGNQPSAIAVDPKYPYAFVANATDGTVNAYAKATMQ